jgi:hypothetical protein
MRPGTATAGSTAMREFFDQNETIILFAHGLVFFSLGFAVWIQRRRASRLVLTNALIWLAAFAFIEAFAVWGQVFVPIQEEYLDDSLVDALIVLRGLLQTAGCGGSGARSPPPG